MGTWVGHRISDLVSDMSNPGSCRKLVDRQLTETRCDGDNDMQHHFGPVWRGRHKLLEQPNSMVRGKGLVHMMILLYNPSMPEDVFVVRVPK